MVVRRPALCPPPPLPRSAFRRPTNRRARREPRPTRRVAPRRRRSARPPARPPGDTLARAAFERGPRLGPREVARRRRAAHTRRGEDRAPTGASAEMREQRVRDRGVVGVGRLLAQRVQAQHDARRAEATLTCAGRAERIAPRAAIVIGQSLDGGHGPSLDAARRRHTRDTRLTVDEHGATPALALRAAPVFDRAQAQSITQDLEQRRTVVGNGHGPTVDVQLEIGHRRRIGGPLPSDAVARPGSGSVVA